MTFQGFLKLATARHVSIVMVSSTDHISGKTGLSGGLTIYALNDASGAASAITPTVAEPDAVNMPGTYTLALDTSGPMTGTLGELHLYITATGADPADYKWQVMTNLPGETAPQTGDAFARIGANGVGLTALGDARLNFLDIGVSSRSAPVIPNNVAFPYFKFVMTDATTHAPKTGLTPACTRAIDNFAFAAGTLTNITEIGNGVYRVDFAAADLNGRVVMLRATAAGADDTLVAIITDHT